MAAADRSNPGSYELGTRSPGSPKRASPQRGSPDISVSEPDVIEYSAPDVLGMSDEGLGQYMAGPKKNAILDVFLLELSVEEREQLAKRIRYRSP